MNRISRFIILRKYAIDLSVFMCGALVMIYEIVGSRLLSPFIGASTYVWTSLIGIILGSLSLGYWLGGRLADRRPDVRMLAFVIFGAGGLISITILVKEVLLSFIASAAVSLEIKALLASLLLFAPASVCLGIVTPYAVRLKMSSLNDSGKTVGRLYALSTVGSILGTFVAGFFLIPFVGSVRTLYIIAAVLFAVSLILAPFAVSRINLAAVVLFVFGVGASELNAYILGRSDDLHDIDTEYSRVQVFRTVEPLTGRPIRAIATDPYFVQSAIFLDSDELALPYNRYYHLSRHFKPDLERALIIGGAGYTFPREYLKTYQHASIDVVEIDPQMTEIARRYFRLKDDPRMRIFHEDGRAFLNGAQPAGYDVVLMDAFGSLFSVPYQLATLEAVSRISDVLKDDGVVVFNLGSAIRGDAGRFLRAELATYRKVFPRVFVFKVNTEYTDERLQNLIIVACKSGNMAGLESSDPEIADLLMHLYRPNIPADEPILTDDLAPVEYYNSVAQGLYIAERR